MPVEPPSIYVSPEAEADSRAYYDLCVARLRVTAEPRDVATSWGPTRVWLAGPEHAPPVVLLHGINANAPHVLGCLAPLAARNRLVSVDIIGEPGRSAQTRPPRGDTSFGRWMVEVLDGLGLDRAAFVGTSYGAWVTLNLATVAPARISAAVLVVPAGLSAAGAPFALTRVLVPTLLYRRFKWPGLLTWMAAPFFSPDEPLHPDWLTLFEVGFRCVRLDPRPMRTHDRADLAGLVAPTFLIVGDRDPIQPAAAVVAAARSALPNLVRVQVTERCAHIPPVGRMDELWADPIGRFLDETRG